MYCSRCLIENMQSKTCSVFSKYVFSHTVVQILRSFDVLANEALRQGLMEYSSWPAFLEYYIDGVSQNTDSKMCSAFLINAAIVFRWPALTSCQSSAQRFWPATRSVASPTWWCRFCGRSMCPSKRSMR
ncbi:uncharacterized protein [Triticum aestivum]|uniref:uncharacterized protein isoform X2 n=1 Tax=Triticum aestivum TaxID=4565 RepID=UPI001D0149C6|nr:uncharacterized protein LOC123114347 isoform X2 [Triticum aestivum]